jgi:Fe-S cluster assembly protein SufD
VLGVAEEKEHYLASFAKDEKAFARSGPVWLQELRRAAIRRFEALGFPTLRDEAWRFTSVEAIAKTPFERPEPAAGAEREAVPEALRERLFDGLGAVRIAFIDGFYSRELSSRRLESGVVVSSLKEALETSPGLVQAALASRARFENHAFVALNTAFLEDGAFVHVPDGMVVEELIHILHLSSRSARPRVTHPRTLVLAGRGSQAVLVESYAGAEEGAAFTNAVTEIAAGEGAVLHHTRIQEEGLEAFHISTQAVHLERSSNYRSISISLGGALVRNDVEAVLDGEGVDCVLDGLYVATGRQHIDNFTRIEHARPHCHSWELYKGILDDAARAVFCGKIHVHQDAQKTDAKQSNRNLLLSPDAVVNTKPQLEIFADDVKCTHGATIGQIDEEAVFYLRSRGLDRTAARQLLTHAFAAEILGEVRPQALRKRLDEAIFRRLRLGGEAPEGGPCP